MPIRTPVSRKGDAFRIALLEYVFLNQPIAGIGDVSGILGSAVVGDLYISLHDVMRDWSYNGGSSQYGVFDEGENEIAYTNYARVAVPRNSTYWEISGNRIRNKLDITFPADDFTLQNIDPRIVGVNTAAAGGGGKMLYAVPCLLRCDLHTGADIRHAGGTTSPIPVSESPVLRAGNLLIEDV